MTECVPTPGRTFTFTFWFPVEESHTNDPCGMGRYKDLQSSYGYVSSRVAREQGVGTIQCPWRIEALPGQSISISVISLGDPVQQHSCKTLGYVYKSSIPKVISAFVNVNQRVKNAMNRMACLW